MAEVPGGEGGGAAAEVATPTPTPLTVSGSFKEGKGSTSRRRGSMRPPSMDADELMNLLHGSNPVKVELNRLENEVRGAKMWLDPKSSSADFFSCVLLCVFVDCASVCVCFCVQIRTGSYQKRRPRLKP